MQANAPAPGKTVIAVLAALSFSHLLNDAVQALVPSIYPLVKDSFGLTFTQIGLITLTYQLTASLLQPFVGLYADRRPIPWSLPVGMAFSLAGLVLLALGPTYGTILLASALVGLGSSVFHPEASRVARIASGGRHGLAQSLFQVGGNVGTSLGPLMAAAVVVPYGRGYILWFTLLALAGIAVLSWVGGWYRRSLERSAARAAAASPGPAHSKGRIAFAVAILMALIFSKYFYLAAMISYYTFFLIGKFGISVQAAQVHLFVFLFAVAAGTILGGPIGDRFGRKRVIWASILGVAPFTLLLPRVGLFWMGFLAVLIGLILASAFSAILVYAQELIPGKVGLVAGLFFGFAFGMGGIGSAVLGKLADLTSIPFVFEVCAYLPLIGLLTALLPEVGPRRQD